jgi:flavin-dependent dehydrogenase
MNIHRTNSGSVIETDVCVTGGGPAGATIARRLALLGHRVCLVEKARYPRPKVGESLTPNILPLLETLGLRDRIEGDSFLRPDKSIVHWSGAREQLNYQTDQRGLLVDRGRFDYLLLESAREAGVTVLQPAQAMRPILDEDDCWHLPIRYGVESIEIKARYLAEATGRHSLLGGKRTRCSAPLIALYGYWRNTNFDTSAIRVEAGLEEWFWGAPLPDGSFNATVFTDPDGCRGMAGRVQGLDSLYLSLLAGSSLLRGGLTGTLAGRVKACDASSYFDDNSINEHSIKVGESSFSIDPLSSQGVQAAINSALQGSIAVHTILTRAENSAAAIDFYGARQREAVELHRNLSAQYYAESRFRDAGAFWQKRSDVVSKSFPVESETSPILFDHLRLNLSDSARFVATPCVTGNVITNIPALTHPNLERRVAYLKNIEALLLFDSFPQGGTVADIVRAWSRYFPRNDSLETLDWLCRSGILVPAH